jgi:hypothetical protein
MFRHMYVIIRELSLCVLLSYIKDAYNFVIYVKGSLHSMVVVNTTFEIQIVKSSGYNTDYSYILVLIFVLCPDGSIYIDGLVLLV